MTSSVVFHDTLTARHCAGFFTIFDSQGTSHLL